MTVPLPDPDLRREYGPFDIIGDVHGCCDELEVLLERLGYRVGWDKAHEPWGVRICAPPARRAIFVGDLTDRGPRSLDVLRIVLAMSAAGQAFCVPGNHDDKLMRWLKGRNVSVRHGLETTVAQFEVEASGRPMHGGDDGTDVGEVFTGVDEKRGAGPCRLKTPLEIATCRFIERLPSHLWLEGGALVVAHAGIRADMVGQHSKAARSFCLFGDVSGERDEYGLPVRRDWARDHGGDPAIVYGHTPKPDTGWVNNTICIDTGCCFGGALTSLRWPERDMISVPALREYAVSRRPLFA